MINRSPDCVRKQRILQIQMWCHKKALCLSRAVGESENTKEYRIAEKMMKETRHS